MSIRRERVAEQVKSLIGSCFLGGRLDDPRLQNLTISYVKVSADLQVATVYYRVFGEHSYSEQEMTQALEQASPIFRKLLAQNLKLRRVPDLRFFYDHSIDRADRIETLLSSLNED